MGWIVLIFIIIILMLSLIIQKIIIWNQVASEIRTLYQRLPGQLVPGQKLYKAYKSYAESFGAKEISFDLGIIGYFFEQELPESVNKVAITVMRRQNASAYISVGNPEEMLAKALKSSALDNFFEINKGKENSYHPTIISALLVGVRKGILHSQGMIDILETLKDDEAQLKLVIRNVLLSSLSEGHYNRYIIESDHKLSAIIDKTADEICETFIERYSVLDKDEEHPAYDEDDDLPFPDAELDDDSQNIITDRNQEEQSLVNIIKKTNNLPEGIFANINNDLNEHIRLYHSPMTKMAYAYARRTVAAGLFLQGVFSRANYMQASKVFKAMQLHTGQTYEFQEEAAQQAFTLLSSYDNRIDKNIIRVLC